MCKMVISPGIFSIFENFDFLGCLGWGWGGGGVKGRKMSQNDKTFCVTPYISGTIYHTIFIYGAHM